jgi:long-chain acyl-CoA synthetase
MQVRWKSIEDFLTDLNNRYGKNTALTIRDGQNWRSLSFADLHVNAVEAARVLQQSGLKAGDRLALLGPASLEWPVEFLGSLLAGAMVLPLDHKLSFEEHRELLRHNQPRYLLVAKDFREEAYSLLGDIPGLEKVLFLDEPVQILAGQELPAFPARDLKECAAIFYTSGTIGNPKGVMISIENILFELTTLTSLHENHPGDVLFSILPLNHLYGLIMMLYSLASGSELCFAHSLAGPDIALCLRERQATQMNVVPLLLSVLRRAILQKVEGEGPAKSRIFQFLLKIAPYLPLATRRRLFSPIHEGFGGRLRRIVCGASALDPETYDFYRALGLPVYEGYGLTETGPVVSVNTTRRVKRGTVGRPLPQVEVRLDQAEGEAHGELLVRGPNVMLGYYKNPELSRELVDFEGWFRTGDLARLENGYLRITGRLKTLIVLETGKKVHAEEVEMVLQLSNSFQDVCVFGSRFTGKGELVVAVIHPAQAMLEEFPNEDELKREVEREVQELSRRLAAFKRPARVVVRKEAMPKTTSGKIKRHLLQKEIEGNS